MNRSSVKRDKREKPKADLTPLGVLVALLLVMLPLRSWAVVLPAIPEIPGAPVVEAHGKTYHVSIDSGMDGPGRGSSRHPFKTIQYAAGHLKPGDTLLIQGSERPYREEVWIRSTGLPSNYIVISGVGPKKVKLFHPIGRKASKGFVFSRSSAYVCLRNVEVSGGFRQGVNIRPGSRHILVENMKVYGNRFGLFVSGGRHIYVRNVEIYNNENRGVFIFPKSEEIVFNNVLSHDNRGSEDADGFGLTLANTPGGRPKDPVFFCKNIYFMNCSSFGNAQDGFDIGLAKGVVIRNCRSYNNGGNGIKLWGTANWILNSLIYRNGHSGIMLKPIWKMQTYILNNTIAGNRYAQVGTTDSNRMRGGKIQLSSVQVDLYNNIIIAHDNKTVQTARLFDITRNGSIVEDYNLFYSAHGQSNAIIFRDQSVSALHMDDLNHHAWRFHGSRSGGRSFVVDPLLVNYEPSAGSPAIDRGTNVGLDVDLLGVKRPQGGGFDIGAYEYVPVP